MARWRLAEASLDSSATATTRLLLTAGVPPVGVFGALVDAIGGGGWGPIVGSTLIVRGASVRLTVGSLYR